MCSRVNTIWQWKFTLEIGINTLEEVTPESGKENNKLYAKESGDLVMDILLDMLFITTIQSSMLCKSSLTGQVLLELYPLHQLDPQVQIIFCSVNWEESCLEDYEQNVYPNWN